MRVIPRNNPYHLATRSSNATIFGPSVGGNGVVRGYSPGRGPIWRKDFRSSHSSKFSTAQWKRHLAATQSSCASVLTAKQFSNRHDLIVSFSLAWHFGTLMKAVASSEPFACHPILTNLLKTDALQSICLTLNKRHSTMGMFDVVLDTYQRTTNVTKSLTISIH